MANDTATSPTKAASAAKAKAAKTTRAASSTRSTAAARAKKTAAGKASAAGKTTKRNTATADRAGSRGTTVLAGDYAERAILIPVGIALSARDRVLSSVNEVISSYSSPPRPRLSCANSSAAAAPPVTGSSARSARPVPVSSANCASVAAS